MTIKGAADDRRPFPAPLEPAREAFFIGRLKTEQAGEAKAILIEHNLGLVVYIAKRFYNTGVGLEDLTSVGAIGLVKAVNTFDPVKKIKLATYASRCIENEILMYLRRSLKERREISLEEPFQVDKEGKTQLLGEVLGTEEDVVSRHLEEELELARLKKAVSSLSQREQTMIRLRFGFDSRDEKEKT
ncbi:RNA polymerase, sigma 29 subunit, SigE, partial [gut metagenome]